MDHSETVKLLRYAQRLITEGVPATARACIDNVIRNLENTQEKASEAPTISLLADSVAILFDGIPPGGSITLSRGA